MTDNVVRREVQRRDDPFGIPACFYWTIDEVADWVESIGYGKYKENFRSHFINGRKLLTVDACVLPKMGITHFGDILELAGIIRDILGKGSRATWLPPVPSPKFYPVPQRLEVVACTGNDLDYNWRYWVPEYHYGYMPKESPVTKNDFKDLAKVIQCLIHARVPAWGCVRPKPRPAPIRLKTQLASKPEVPWWEQKRHMTFLDYVQGINRIQAARLANQRQYYMGP